MTAAIKAFVVLIGLVLACLAVAVVVIIEKASDGPGSAYCKDYAYTASCKA